MHYNISGRKWKAGNLAYKTGKSFTKWESCLQNRNLIYKVGLLDYKRDSRLAIYPIYYDNVKDANNNIVGRRIYVALGSDKDYDKSDMRNDVKDSGSFDEFIKRQPNRFVEIEIPVQIAVTVNWEDLKNNTTKYPAGAIVKVIHGSEVEYYIANSTSSSERVLGNISTNDKKGWWRLDILSS